jgi:hypothetical protein
MPLAAFGASAVSVWATGFWWLVPAGLAAAFLAAALGHRDERGASVAPPEAARAQLRPLLAEKARILAELAESGGDGVLDGADVAARVDRVVQAYDGLLEKLDVLRTLLAERGLSGIEDSIRDLERQHDACTDEEARGDLSLALKNRIDERDRLVAMGRYRERVEARLLGLASALTNLRVRLVQGRVSQDGALDAATGVRQVLESLFHEVEVAERTSLELNQIVPREAVRPHVPAAEVARERKNG